MKSIIGTIKIEFDCEVLDNESPDQTYEAFLNFLNKENIREWITEVDYEIVSVCE